MHNTENLISIQHLYINTVDFHIEMIVTWYEMWSKDH